MDSGEKVMKVVGLDKKKVDYKIGESSGPGTPIIEHGFITSQRNKQLRRNFNFNPTASGPTLVSRQSKVKLQMENLNLTKFQRYVTKREQATARNQQLSIEKLKGKLAFYQKHVSDMPDPQD